MTKDNPHKGHRERVRKEFLENGFTDTTPPHKILEMLLFYSIPRTDTNEIAHALLDRFGSISGIMEASAGELMRVEGIGESSAALLKLLLPLCRQYAMSRKADKGPMFLNFDKICDYVIKKYIGITKETFSLISFNNTNRIIAFDILNTGDLTSVGITTRTVIEKALERRAVNVVIAHNHPNGDARPSDEDLEMTARLKLALSHIRVNLIDHVIVADDDGISMTQSGEYYQLFE